MASFFGPHVLNNNWISLIAPFEHRKPRAALKPSEKIHQTMVNYKSKTSDPEPARKLSKHSPQLIRTWPPPSGLTVASPRFILGQPGVVLGSLAFFLDLLGFILRSPKFNLGESLVLRKKFCCIKCGTAASSRMVSGVFSQQCTPPDAGAGHRIQYIRGLAFCWRCGHYSAGTELRPKLREECLGHRTDSGEALVKRIRKGRAPSNLDRWPDGSLDLPRTRHKKRRRVRGKVLFACCLPSPLLCLIRCSFDSGLPVLETGLHPLVLLQNKIILVSQERTLVSLGESW